MVVKTSMVQKIYDTEKVNKVSHLHYDLDLENNYLIFTQNIPAYDDVQST